MTELSTKDIMVYTQKLGLSIHGIKEQQANFIGKQLSQILI